MKRLLYLLMFLFCTTTMAEIIEVTIIDDTLCNALVVFLKQEKADNVLTIGSGILDYTTPLRENNFNCEAYDGRSSDFQVSGDVGRLNLGQPFDLGKTFDWIIALEIERCVHIENNDVFIENLCQHGNNGIILSWRRYGICNANKYHQEYIKKTLAEHGFYYDENASNILREQSTFFKENLSVFRKAK